MTKTQFLLLWFFRKQNQFFAAGQAACDLPMFACGGEPCGQPGRVGDGDILLRGETFAPHPPGAARGGAQIYRAEPGGTRGAKESSAIEHDHVARRFQPAPGGAELLMAKTFAVGRDDDEFSVRGEKSV